MGLRVFGLRHVYCQRSGKREGFATALFNPVNSLPILHHFLKICNIFCRLQTIQAFLFWPEVVPSGKYCYIYSLKILSGGASLGYLSM